MDKNSLWIILPVALTAVVTLMTKIVEYRSAILRFKKEREPSETPKIESGTLNVTAPVPRRELFMPIFSILIYIFSIAALFYFFLFAPARPATLKDVAFLVLVAVTAITASRPSD